MDAYVDGLIVRFPETQALEDAIFEFSSVQPQILIQSFTHGCLFSVLDHPFKGFVLVEASFIFVVLDSSSF